MERLIFKLRRALIQYEECVDVDAAEHIIGKSLIDLQNAAYAVANEASKMLSNL